MKKKKKLWLISGIIYLLIAITATLILILGKNQDITNVFIGISFIPFLVYLGLITIYGYVIANSKKPKLKYLKSKPILIITSLITLGIIISGLVIAIKTKEYGILFVIAFYIVVAIVAVYSYFSLFREDKIFSNEKTNRYIGIAVDDEYYLNGVNIFDSNNSKKINKEIITVKTKIEKPAEEILYVKGKEFKFLVAYHTLLTGEKIIYAVRHADYYKLMFLDINSYLEKDQLINDAKVLEKCNIIDEDKKYFYNKDYSKRMYVIEKNNKFYCIIELKHEKYQYDDLKDKIVCYYELKKEELNVKHIEEAEQIIQNKLK